MSYSPKNQKLVPEWGVDEDEQIVILGVIGLVVMTIALSVGLLRGGGDTTDSANETATEQASESATLRDNGLAQSGVVAAALTNSSTATPTTTTPAATAPTTAAPTTAAPTTAAPTTAAPSTTAVPPTTIAPDLEPDVVSALTAAGVVGPEATVDVAGDGAIATVSGTVSSEEARDQALAAAATVSGVTEVVDELTVEAPVQDQLNKLFELEPIQFASGSATILDASTPTLDAASQILGAAPEGTRLEVQGYTDLGGPASKNLTLSQERADAVAAYLVSSGVDAEVLVAKGYGETDQFQAGDLAEDYEANRRVQFVAVTGT